MSDPNPPPEGDDTAPDETVPDSTVPDSTVPDSTAPDDQPIAEDADVLGDELDEVLAGLTDEALTDDPADQPTLDDVDVAALLAEREEFLEAYRRTQADFENYRKQAQRRQTEEVSRALGAFAERLLPVLDAGDAAIAHGDEGARAVYEALLAALEKEGLRRVDPLGEPFDPNVAEAVAHEPGDGGEQTVAAVFRAGYLWDDRVLRPAMVKVKD